MNNNVSKDCQEKGKKIKGKKRASVGGGAKPGRGERRAQEKGGGGKE